MHDVDYEAWADYIDEVIMLHHHEAEEILELACGTGTTALSLEELGYYIITATDGSKEMVVKARQKAAQTDSEIRFEQMNFLNIDIDRKFDVAFMIFDSLNYLHTEEEIKKLHQEVRKVLKPGGLFIYDFTTPRNSENAIQFLDNTGGEIDDRYRYIRSSSFDKSTHIHTNRFKIEQIDKENGGMVVDQFEEEHQQKIYSLKKIQSIVEQTDFEILQAYGGFELKPANSNSLRITMVLR